MSENNEGMVSVDDAAKLLSVSKSTVYAWLKDPDLQPEFPTPVSIPNSKKLAIPRKELNDYLNWLLDQRRIAPVTHRNERGDQEGMSTDEKCVYENRAQGRADDFGSEAND